MANEDVKISKEAVQAHFQLIIDEMRSMIAHREFQLGNSHDFADNSNKEYVAAVVKLMRTYLKIVETSIYSIGR